MVIRKSFFASVVCGLACGALSLGLAACSTARTNMDGVPVKKELTRTERARMLIEIANSAILEGDAVGALENLLKAQEEDPNLPELYHSKALAYYMKHDVPTAIGQARKAVELKPDYSDANNTLGKLLMDAGQPDQAIAPLLTASKDPLYRDAYKPLTNLGILYYRQGAYERSGFYLGKAIEDAPGAACVAYYYRGHLRLRESRFTDAESDYDNAGKHACTGFADARLALGIAYERGKQYGLARKTFMDVHARFPNTKVAEQAMNHLRFLP
jgi:Tfp pilus assembly protein PilF